MENPFKDPDDKLVFAKVLDKFAESQKKHRPSFTDFLNPVQCGEFMQILYKYTNDIKAFGGYEGAERMIIGFGISTDIFPITPLSFTYNGKFSKSPSHRDYLGATLGLGLDRCKIGDIRLSEEGAVLYAASDIAHFIAENLTQVGRTTVKISIGENIAGLTVTGETCRVTVASLRLDAVLSGALNLSRGKVSTLIASDKVFINWKPAKKTQQLQAGDSITIRGIGRITVDAEAGRSKKDKFVLEISKF